jgi:DNA-binding response OmpR family regulator
MKNDQNLLTILAVDDCDVTLKLVKKVLGDDYRVLTANKAENALKIIYQEPVKLLLLDVEMPGIDGLELCRTVRNLSQFKDIPIIMLTAKDGAFDKVQGKIAGASEYLIKPFERDQLLQLIHGFLIDQAVKP